MTQEEMYSKLLAYTQDLMPIAEKFLQEDALLEERYFLLLEIWKLLRSELSRVGGDVGGLPSWEEANDRKDRIQADLEREDQGSFEWYEKGYALQKAAIVEELVYERLIFESKDCSRLRHSRLEKILSKAVNFPVDPMRSLMVQRAMEMCIRVFVGEGKTSYDVLVWADRVKKSHMGGASTIDLRMAQRMGELAIGMPKERGIKDGLAYVGILKELGKFFKVPFHELDKIKQDLEKQENSKKNYFHLPPGNPKRKKAESERRLK